MTTKFTNIKNEVFTSKEHYLAFRQAWKDYINSGKAKPSYVENGYGGKEKVSNLNGPQHLLFSILIGRDLSRSFRPALVNDCKHGFHDALHSLSYTVSLAKAIVEYDEFGDEVEIPSYLTRAKYVNIVESQRKRLEEFLEPFGVVTPKMIYDIFGDHLNQKDFSNVVPSTKEAA